MKAYFFKTTRDTATGNIHIQDVMETSRTVNHTTIIGGIVTDTAANINPL